MDERTLPVKIEPEEDLEYDHHQEVCLEIEIDAKPSVDTKDNICNEIQSNTALPFEYVDVPVIKQEVEILIRLHEAEFDLIPDPCLQR
uniref:Uncharacterized protein n=1 Tax=Timema douglasi TaxID=61478 RepID=A0A7R8Z2M9_TIMDO|nr:unnamed protein product [Timema douglasi]